MNAQRQDDEDKQSAAKVLRLPAVINYKGSTPQPADGIPQLRFRDRLACAHRKGEVTGDVAFRLMVLWSRSRSDCHLRGKREGRDSYYDARQLAGFFGVTERTFFTWWQRWKDAGWVDDERPKDRGRLRRWLVAERTGSG